MTNWSAPSTIEAQAVKFNEVVIAFLGLLSWEVVITLWFDFEVITRRRAFKWPMIMHYSMLLGPMGVVIAQNVTTKLNCEALYVFCQLVGNIAIGASSTLLMLRTIAVWTRNRMILYPFILLSLGQWAILLHSVITVSAAWDNVAMACSIKPSPTVNLQVLYLYTMIFDFFVLVATCIGLYRNQNSSGNQLWIMLFQDGLVYFLIAFTCNLVAVVFILLNLNPIMNIIATIPAASVVGIVACRVFVKLMTFNDVSASNTAMSSNRGGAPAVNRVVRQPGLPTSTNPGGARSNGGVRIQMSTFASHTGLPENSNVNFDDGDDDVEFQHEKAIPYKTDRTSSEDFADDKPDSEGFMPRPI
ncbi:hypothetical protein FRB98_007435 [Tulasnella sp. 332]|nr:hypothetical protein FRB98_007435 [Tulasnella sp. 332]